MMFTILNSIFYFFAIVTLVMCIVISIKHFKEVPARLSKFERVPFFIGAVLMLGNAIYTLLHYTDNSDVHMIILHIIVFLCLIETLAELFYGRRLKRQKMKKKKKIKMKTSKIY